MAAPTVIFQGYALNILKLVKRLTDEESYLHDLKEILKENAAKRMPMAGAAADASAVPTKNTLIASTKSNKTPSQKKKELSSIKRREKFGYSSVTGTQSSETASRPSKNTKSTKCTSVTKSPTKLINFILPKRKRQRLLDSRSNSGSSNSSSSQNSLFTKQDEDLNLEIQETKNKVENLRNRLGSIAEQQNDGGSREQALEDYGKLGKLLSMSNSDDASFSDFGGSRMKKAYILMCLGQILIDFAFICIHYYMCLVHHQLIGNDYYELSDEELAIPGLSKFIVLNAGNRNGHRNTVTGSNYHYFHMIPTSFSQFWEILKVPELFPCYHGRRNLLFPDASPCTTSLESHVNCYPNRPLEKTIFLRYVVCLQANAIIISLLDAIFMAKKIFTDRIKNDRRNRIGSRRRSILDLENSLRVSEANEKSGEYYDEDDILNEEDLGKNRPGRRLRRRAKKLVY